MSRDLDMRNKLILKCTNCACLRSTGRSDQLHCTSLIVDHTEVLKNYHSLLSWSANGGSDSMTCCKLAALLNQPSLLRICINPLCFAYVSTPPASHMYAFAHMYLYACALHTWLSPIKCSNTVINRRINQYCTVCNLKNLELHDAFPLIHVLKYLNVKECVTNQQLTACSTAQPSVRNVGGISRPQKSRAIPI